MNTLSNYRLLRLPEIINWTYNNNNAGLNLSPALYSFFSYISIISNAALPFSDTLFTIVPGEMGYIEYK